MGDSNSRNYYSSGGEGYIRGQYRYVPATPGGGGTGGGGGGGGGGTNDRMRNGGGGSYGHYSSSQDSNHYNAPPPPKNYTQSNGDRNSESRRSTIQSTPTKPATRKPLSKYDRARLQPTVEDVPDEDDHRSNGTSSSGDLLEAVTGKSSNTSMSSDGSAGEKHKKKEQERKPSSSSTQTKISSPRTDPIPRPSRPPPASATKPPPPTPPPRREEPKQETPELEPRKSTPYSRTYTSPKPEQVAPVPQNLNVIPESNGTVNGNGIEIERERTPYSSVPKNNNNNNNNNCSNNGYNNNNNNNSYAEPDQGRRRTPYAYTPTKDTFAEELGPRTPAPYGSKASTENEDYFNGTRKPAPYSKAYPHRVSPPRTPPQRPPYKSPPASSFNEPPVTPPSNTTERGRTSTPYSYVPPRSTTSSENTSTPIKRQPSGRADARSSSRASTPVAGVQRTVKPYQDEHEQREDPIVTKVREAETRRQPSPYSSYTPSGSVSTGTAPKLQRNPSQGYGSSQNYPPGQYSNVPANLQSTGSLKRQASPAASFSSPSSSRYSSTSSPKPSPYPPPPAPLATGFDPTQYSPPYASEPGQYQPSSHSPYSYPYQQSPLSYLSPVAQPMWITEPEPAGPTCPESSEINWGTWYHPPYASKFSICEGCYKRYIQSTPFSPHFTKIDTSLPQTLTTEEPTPVLRSCMFHPVLVKELWQAMCRTQGHLQQQNPYYQQDAAAFYEFAQRRSELLNCAGTKGVQPPSPGASHPVYSKWPRWWASPKDLPNFLICEGCFVDYMDTSACFPEGAINRSAGGSIACTSPFKQFFQPYTIEHYLRQNQATVDGELPVWVCDVGSNMLIKHLLEEANKQPRAGGTAQGSWEHFVGLARWRINEARPCPGQPMVDPGNQLVIAGPRTWYGASGHFSHGELTVCEACYYDLVIPANIEHEFQRFVVEPNEKQPQCHLSMMEFRFPLSIAKETKDYGVFWKAAEWALSLQPCDDQGYELTLDRPDYGIPGGVEWYVFLGAVPGGDYEEIIIDCCPRCWHTLIQPSSFGDRFERILPGGRLERDTSGGPNQGLLDQKPFRICSFTQAAPTRFQKTWMKLLEATHQKDFSPLVTFMHSSPDKLIPCAKDAIILTPAENRGTGGQRWFSTPGDGVEETVLACEECFETQIRGTVFESHFDDITHGIITHLNDPILPQDHEIILLCSLYSPRQRSLLQTCLANVPNYHHDTPIEEMIHPLLEVTVRRFRTYMSVRDELRHWDEQEDVLNAQLDAMKLDDQVGDGYRYSPGEEARVLARKADLEGRMNALSAMWRGVE